MFTLSLTNVLVTKPNLKAQTIRPRPLRRLPNKQEQHTLVCQQQDGFWNTKPFASSGAEGKH